MWHFIAPVGQGWIILNFKTE